MSRLCLRVVSTRHFKCREKCTYGEICKLRLIMINHSWPTICLSDQLPSKDRGHRLRRPPHQMSPPVPYSHTQPQEDLSKNFMQRQGSRYYEHTPPLEPPFMATCPAAAYLLFTRYCLAWTWSAHQLATSITITITSQLWNHWIHWPRDKFNHQKPEVLMDNWPSAPLFRSDATLRRTRLQYRLGTHIPRIEEIASPPPRMLGTARMALYFCKKVRIEALKKGSIEILKPP